MKKLTEIEALELLKSVSSSAWVTISEDEEMTTYLVEMPNGEELGVKVEDTDNGLLVEIFDNENQTIFEISEDEDGCHKFIDILDSWGEFAESE